MTKIRVLVVDDSSFMRAAVAKTLGSDARLEVIGQAKDGADAVEKVRQLKPDVVTMDFNMPRMNGAEAIRAIFATQPVPVIMLSAHTLAGADETLEALSAGAVDFMTKPDGEVSTDLSKIKDALIAKVLAAAKSTPQMRAPKLPANIERLAHLRDMGPGQTLSGLGPSTGTVKAPQHTPPTGMARPSTTPATGVKRDDRSNITPGGGMPRQSRTSLESIAIIAVSTGGPAALEQVVPALPKDFARAVVIVQHMPAQFTLALAKRLDALSALEVREAVDGDRPKPGLVLMAPGDRHLVLERSGVVRLTDTPPVHGCRPSADVTLQSAAPIYGDRLIAVVMTGMGRDGALGAAAVKSAQGRVLAQDKASSVVYGMPKAVIEMGVADEVVPLSKIATRLRQL